MSRNAIPSSLKDLFNLTNKEQKEYDNAETEDEIANICIKDAKMRGGLLISRE